MLGKLSVPGRPTNLDKRTALAVAAVGCCLDIFFFSFSLSGRRPDTE